MKKIITLLLLLLPIYTLAQKVYYVAHPDSTYKGMGPASDDNKGSFAHPWASWQKGFNNAMPGDTVYIRGGTWVVSQPARHSPPSYGNNGTYGNIIVFTNYEDEKPILDCSGFPVTRSTGVGLSMYKSNYIKFKGLTVQNVFQTEPMQAVKGGSATYVGTVWWEQCTARYNGGHGFQWAGYDTIYVHQCDSYENADNISPSQGNRADGFAGGSGGTETDTTKVAYYTECRAWRVSDDGFDFGTTKQFQVSNCWAFSNGLLADGIGTAFKTNPSHVINPHKRRIANCLAAYNKDVAFIATNLNDTIWGPCVELINNTSYHNSIGFGSSRGAFDCDQPYGNHNVIIKNNVAYHNRNQMLDQYAWGVCSGPETPDEVDQSNNTWYLRDVSPYTQYSTINGVTWAYTGMNDQFVSVADSVTAFNQMSAPRKPDGSLPDIDFMKLAPGSILIDAGVDVGLEYFGEAPDLGYSESEYEKRYIKITKPLSGDKYKDIDPILFKVTVSDPDLNLNKVVYFINNNQLGETSTAPWSYNWRNPTIGDYKLQAFAIYNENDTIKSDIVPFSVVKPTPPSIEITRPKEGERFQEDSNILIETEVADPYNIINKVIFVYNENIRIGEALSEPWSYNWENTSIGNYNLQAIAIYNESDTAYSNPVNISIEPTPPPLPSIRITSPQDGDIFQENDKILIKTEVSDIDGTINKVEFFYNYDIKIGEALSEPWSYTWTNTTAGNYKLQSFVIYNENDTANSTPVNISIKKPIIFEILKAFPDPTIDLFVIDFSSPNAGNITIKVLDKFTNNLVIIEEYPAKTGLNRAILNLASFPTSTYIVTLNNGQTEISTTVDKQ